MQELFVPSHGRCRISAIMSETASTVLHGGFGLSAILGDVRPLEEALEIMLQV
jgi:hypothetical protein